MTRRNFVLLLLFPFAFLPFGCGSAPPPVALGWTPDSPATYRVNVVSESSFSGATSDVEAATHLTAAFRVSPVSDSKAEVEVVYLAADIADGSGEMVSLGIENLTGREATVAFDTPGVVSEIRGNDALLDAPIPLVSLEETMSTLFPPLPEGSFRPGDTWTGDSLSPFPNIEWEGNDPLRMRYVLDAADTQSATVEGYELSLQPRTYGYQTPEGGVTGEGNFDIEFEGDLDTGSGYQRIEKTSEFDTDFIRLEGGGYANGNLHLTSRTTVERLNVTEQFGTNL